MPTPSGRSPIIERLTGDWDFIYQSGQAMVDAVGYLDIDVQPRQVPHAPLPWSLTMVTTQPGAFTDLVAQGDSDFLGCRIVVDDEVKDEGIVNAVHAYTFCPVKSA